MPIVIIFRRCCKIMTECEWIDIFRRNLHELMAERGYFQSDLAEAAGLSQTTISRYLNGDRMPNLRSIINLSYELDVDVSELIDFGDRIEG